MEARIVKLEEFAAETRERLARIESRLEQTATKADLHELAATMIKWIVGTVSGMSIAGITIMSFVLNNAVPKTPPAPAQVVPPVVIQLPSPVAPATSIPAK